jgi:hypothetical protein
VLLYGPVNLVTILFYSSPLILPFMLFAIRHSDSEGFRALRGLVDFFILTITMSMLALQTLELYLFL